MHDDERLRVQLIERLCRASAETLREIERLLARTESPLECGGLTPLSFPLECGTTRLADSPTPLSPLQRNVPITQRDWPHAPLHRLSEHGTYIVTAGTLHKQHFFRGTERLDLLETQLLTLARQYGVQLEAWAVFSNHYHFVAHTMPDQAVEATPSSDADANPQAG